jgi:predicted Rossmann fold flavoprotein
MIFDTIIIGAGAAGFMAAITSAQYGQKTLLIDSNKKLCEKIRISGGGRCNFTNLNASYETYKSCNPNFVRSALSQYGPEDFIALVEKHKIKFHEKKLGQLFCDDSSQEIINLLRNEAHTSGVEVIYPMSIKKIHIKDQDCSLDLQKKIKEKLDFKIKKNFACESTGKVFEADKLIIATGGLSIPQLGTSSFGYDLARLLGLNIIDTEPGLVPLLLSHKLLNDNTGLSFDVKLNANEVSFRENILITHKGLSGPATLQISNYWQPKDELVVNFCPDLDLESYLLKNKKCNPNVKLGKLISEIEQKKNIATFTNKIDREFIFSKNFLKSLAEVFVMDKNIQEYSDDKLKEFAGLLNSMKLNPSDYEGYEKAEVTKGGIDTNELDQKTMQVKSCEGLYFIGELVDVTGWLGGYNFQWAWASGFAAGQDCS